MKRFRRHMSEVTRNYLNDLNRKEKKEWLYLFNSFSKPRKLVTPKRWILFDSARKCKEAKEINNRLIYNNKKPVKEDTIINVAEVVLFTILEKVDKEWLKRKKK